MLIFLYQQRTTETDAFVLNLVFLMHRYQVFYCEQPDGKAGFEPVIASDAYEACREVERRHPGALLASIDGELTDEVTARKLFTHWLSTL